MKFLRLLPLFLCLSVFPVTSGMSCKPTQQRVTYNTLATIGQTVNKAYAAYLDQVVAGKAKYSQTLAQDYNKFQGLYNTAVQAASMNLQAPTPTDLEGLGRSIITAINTLKL